MQNTPNPRRTLKLYILSAIFGIIGGLLTIVTIGILDFIVNTIWENIFGLSVDDPTRSFAAIAVLVIFGLIIGLLSKRFGPVKGNIESVIAQSLEQGHVNWRLAAKNIGISLISIGSGASLGPEAPSAMLAAGTTSFIAQKAKLDTEASRAINIAAISGMLGSLLSSPFVGIAMIIETSKESIKNLRNIISYTLIAGSFGMATFFVLFGKLYSFDFGVPAYVGPTASDLFKAFLFGIIGAVFAIIVGLVMRALEPLFKKLDTKLVARSLVGATIAGIIAFALPLTMFSGQHELSDVVTHAATMSFIMLLLLALGKLLATGVLLRTGFFGGPIFPAIFAGAVLGLAAAKIIDASASLAIAATIAGLITVMQKQPLTAAIVTLAIMGSSSVGPVGLAVAAGMLVVMVIETAQAKKA